MSGQREPRQRDIRGGLGKKTKNPLDNWCDKGNLAIWLGVQDETITEWQKKEGLPFAQIGRTTLFNLLDIDKFLKGRVVIVCPEDLGENEGQKKEGTTKRAGAHEIRAI